MDLDINFKKHKKERLEQFKFKSSVGMENYKFILENAELASNLAEVCLKLIINNAVLSIGIEERWLYVY